MSAPRRVLLVSLDNLGDLVLAGALIAPLRAAGFEVSVWCKEYASGLIPFLPGVARAIASDPFWDRAPGRPAGSTLRFLRALLDVREARFDAALLPNTRRRVAFAVRAAGIPRRIGFDQRGSKFWLTDALSAERRDVPVAAEWSRLLAPLAADPALAVAKLSVPAELEPRRAEFAARLGPRALAVHPFAGDARRCAPARFWPEFLRRVDAERVFVFGAPEESRAFAAAAAAKGSPELLTSEVLGARGLRDSLLALSACRAFVGHDSGPLHCASAFGVPSLGLYLPGDWPRARPQGAAPWRALRRQHPADADPAEAAALFAELTAALG
jgi:ADP-heptose:LPS heptosyltransferase